MSVQSRPFFFSFFFSSFFFSFFFFRDRACAKQQEIILNAGSRQQERRIQYQHTAQCFGRKLSFCFVLFCFVSFCFVVFSDVSTCVSWWSKNRPSRIFLSHFNSMTATRITQGRGGDGERSSSMAKTTFHPNHTDRSFLPSWVWHMSFTQYPSVMQCQPGSPCLVTKRSTSSHNSLCFFSFFGLLCLHLAWYATQPCAESIGASQPRYIINKILIVRLDLPRPPFPAAKYVICIWGIFPNPIQFRRISPVALHILQRKAPKRHCTLFVQPQWVQHGLEFCYISLYCSFWAWKELEKIPNDASYLFSWSFVEQHARSKKLPRILIELFLQQSIWTNRRIPKHQTWIWLQCLLCDVRLPCKFHQTSPLCRLRLVFLSAIIIMIIVAMREFVALTTIAMLTHSTLQRF